MRRTIRAVVFDLDGTLSKPGAIDFARLRRRLQIPASSDILSWAKQQPHASELLGIIAEEEELGLANLQRMDGLEELFLHLRSRAPLLRTGILTRNSESVMHRSLHTLGFHSPSVAQEGAAPPLHTFDMLLSREWGPPKPHPAALLHMAASWGVEPFEMVMIGDSGDDTLAAKAAGAIAISIGDDAEAQQHAHHRIPNDLKHLIPLLD